MRNGLVGAYSTFAPLWHLQFAWSSYVILVIFYYKNMYDLFLNLNSRFLAIIYFGYIADDGSYAMKKVLIQNNEQLELVREEIRISSLFSHPNLLPLLDHAIIRVKVNLSSRLYFIFLLSFLFIIWLIYCLGWYHIIMKKLCWRNHCSISRIRDGQVTLFLKGFYHNFQAAQEGSWNHEAYLLFPVHLDGTLLDNAKAMKAKKEFYPTSVVLQIFRQVNDNYNIIMRTYSLVYVF